MDSLFFPALREKANDIQNNSFFEKQLQLLMTFIFILAHWKRPMPVTTQLKRYDVFRMMLFG